MELALVRYWHFARAFSAEAISDILEVSYQLSAAEAYQFMIELNRAA